MELTMSHYRALQAELVTFRGHNGDQGEAYYARPLASGKYPGIVVIHHLPGWDEWIMEVVRKLAHHSTLDHVLAIDFTNEGEGARDRVAVELSADAARALVTHILAALQSGEAAHAGPVSADAVTV
jgi:carboxymethylenebutenolidase